MSTMNVAKFAIKLGIDPSSIPADLQNVVVNLTTAQRRLAAERKKMEAEIAQATADYADRTLASQKLAAEMGVEQAARAAGERKRLEADVAQFTRALMEKGVNDQKAAEDLAFEHAVEMAQRRRALKGEMTPEARMQAERAPGTEQWATNAAADVAAKAETLAAKEQAAVRIALEARIMEATRAHAEAEIAERKWAEEEKTRAAQMAAEKRIALEAEIMQATRVYAERTVADQKYAADSAAEFAAKAALRRKELEAEITEAAIAQADRRLEEEKFAAASSAAWQRKKALEAEEANLRASQQGVTSMRMMSESLDLGLSRPLTRFLSQTFPKLTAAFSSLVGFFAGSALFYFGVEAFERVDRKLDEAKQKEDAYTEAVQRTKMALGEANASSEERLDKALAKHAQLAGDKQGQARFEGLVSDAEQVKEMAASVDKLVEAELREARANQARMGVWSAVGKFLHESFSFEATLNVEKINDQLERVGREFDLRSVQDQINHTSTAADFLTEETKKAHDALTELQNQRAASIAGAGAEVDVSGFGAVTGTLPTPGVTQKEVDAAKAYADALDKIADAEDRRKKGAATTRQNEQDEANKQKAKDLARERAEQVRDEVAAIQKSVAAYQGRAQAAALAADATGKTSIADKAAADAEKALSDMLASANEKYVKGSDDKLAAVAKVRAALEAAAPAIREAALEEQTSKGVEEYGKAYDEFTTHARERIAALHEEAEGHGRLAQEQARELATLVPLQEKLQALKDLYATMPEDDNLGLPPDLVDLNLHPEKRELGGKISDAEGALASAHGQVAGIQSQLQANAFAAELRRVNEEIKVLAGSGISVWAKIDAELARLRESGKLTTEQFLQLKVAMMQEQGAKIIDEFEKLDRRLAEVKATSAAIAAGDPFPKIAAEAAQIGHEFGLSAGQIAQVRQRLLELAQITNVDKAWTGVNDLNPSGSKMAELRAQMDALRSASASGKTSDGVSLSPDALAAVHLEMQAITAEEDAIALKTGGIDAGFNAWIDSLQKVESEGQFVFNELTQATKGFEATAADSLVKILESHANQHQKLLHQLRQMWEGYFAGLAKMAIEHGMQKLLAPVGKSLGGVFGKAAGGAGKDAALTGNTSALSANTQALMALTAKIGMGAGGGLGALIPGGSGGSSWSGGGVAGENADAPVPFFAEGGDASPGSSFISGEAGAERVDLDRRGAAHITPLGFTTKGGDTHNHFDMRGAVVTDDLMRKADALQMIHGAVQAGVAQGVTMTRENGLRSRPER
jgi:hypothetical protein